MYLKKLRIRNFKSIRDADITFPPMTLVVGANAAGKSNLISVFRFLSDIMTQGLETAVSLQGGVEWMANVNLPRGTPIEVSFELDVSKEDWYEYLFGIKTSAEILAGFSKFCFEKISYSLAVNPRKRGGGYGISSECLTITGLCVEDAFSSRERIENKDVGLISCRIFRKAKGVIDFSCDFSGSGSKKNEVQKNVEKMLRNWFAATFGITSFPSNGKWPEALLFRLPQLIGYSKFRETFTSVYDFDSREMKRPSPVATVPYLKEDGSNIAVVLRDILQNKEKKKQLSALMNIYLPFARSTAVENAPGKSLLYKVQESYSEKAFSQEFLSDGTVSVLAILVALYFQKQYILILEEPEWHLHPRLLADILQSAEDVSSEKQVILTTHNPEFLKHAKIENVLLASRDDEGFTKYTFPKNSETVRSFLEHDLGMDDLFLQDMLGI